MQEAFEYLLKCQKHGIFSSGKIFTIDKLNDTVTYQCLYPNCKEVATYVGFQPRNTGMYKGFVKMSCILAPGADVV